MWLKYQMLLIMTLFTIALFVLLTPGVVIQGIPPGGSKLQVALVHGLIFALIYHFTHKVVWAFFYK